MCLASFKNTTDLTGLACLVSGPIIMSLVSASQMWIDWVTVPEAIKISGTCKNKTEYLFAILKE